MKIVYFILGLFLFTIISNCKETKEEPKYEEIVQTQYTYQVQVLALRNSKSIEELGLTYELDSVFVDQFYKFRIKNKFHNYYDAQKFKDSLNIDGSFLVCYDLNGKQVEITKDMVKYYKK